MTDPQRESSYRAYWNDRPEDMIEWAASHSFAFVDWCSYSFAGRKLYDPITGHKLKDDAIIGKFIQFQMEMANVAKTPVYPLIWVSSPPESLHFHTLEFHNGITRRHRATAFKNKFGRLTKLPKKLYGKTWKPSSKDSCKTWTASQDFWLQALPHLFNRPPISKKTHRRAVIENQRCQLDVDTYKGCFYYGDKGHNQLITELILPKKHDGVPIELMGKLNPKIKGQARMLDKHFPEALCFEKQLLALLNS